MPMTISEKILAAHCDRAEVKPGELIEARLDFVFGNDITAPMSIRVFNEAEQGSGSSTRSAWP